MGGSHDPARLVAVAAATAAGIAAMAVIRYTVRQLFSNEDADQKDKDDTPQTTRPPSAEPSVIESPIESPSFSSLTGPPPLCEGDMVRCFLSVRSTVL